MAKTEESVGKLIAHIRGKGWVSFHDILMSRETGMTMSETKDVIDILYWGGIIRKRLGATGGTEYQWVTSGR